MDKLYCFKYDKENGKLTKIEIPEYGTSTNRFTERKTYYFNKPRINKSDSYYQIPEEKIDRFVSDKVFTFNHDVENAKRIIFETMLSKYYKLENERLKLRDAIGEFLKTFPEFDNIMRSL